MEMEVSTFIFVAICGLGIGILSGMFGIGGGGMIVPLLHMVFGLPMTGAASTSLLTIAPTGISGSIRHLRQKTASLRAGLIMGGIGAVACVAGSLVAAEIPGFAVVTLTVVVILFSVGMMIRTVILDYRTSRGAEAKEAEQAKGIDGAATAKIPAAATESPVPAEAAGSPSAMAGKAAVMVESLMPAATAGSAGTVSEEGAPAMIETLVPAEKEACEKISLKQAVGEKIDKEGPDDQKRMKQAIVLPLIIGVVAGGVAGIVGVGGGFIIVPFCVAYLGFSLKKASGTSLVAISLISIPGIISHALLGHIWWVYGVAIMLGTIPGAQIGAWLISRLPERPMRVVFAFFLASIGILMLVQEFFV